MSPERTCELDGVCSVCGGRAHAGPTLDQFIATFYEVMDEMNPDSHPLAFYDGNPATEAEFKELMRFLWERAKTQRV